MQWLLCLSDIIIIFIFEYLFSHKDIGKDKDNDKSVHASLYWMRKDGT